MQASENEIMILGRSISFYCNNTSYHCFHTQICVFGVFEIENINPITYFIGLTCGSIHRFYITFYILGHFSIISLYTTMTVIQIKLKKETHHTYILCSKTVFEDLLNAL